MLRMMTARPSLTTWLLLAGTACTLRLSLPEMPPIIAEVEGVRIHADSHHRPSGFLSAEEDAERQRNELVNAEVDARRALRQIRWECPSLPSTLQDFCRTSRDDRDSRAGIYVRNHDPSVADKLWVSSFANVQLVAHEFGHLMEWRMLPETFHEAIPHLPAEFPGAAWWKTQANPPSGVFVTHYAQVDKHEWFCETYGAFVAFAAQLGGRLISSAATLDLEALQDVADHYASLGILRADSARFFARVLGDEALRARVDAIRSITQHANRPSGHPYWDRALEVDLAASDWDTLQRCSVEAVPWEKVAGFGPVEGGKLPWYSAQNMQHLEDALAALYQLLAVTGIDPVAVAAAIGSRHDAGDPEGARDLATRATNLAASIWARSSDHAQDSRRSFVEALRATCPEEPSDHFFSPLQLDRDLFYLIGAIRARADLPADALTPDPMPEIRLMLRDLSPPQAFYHYTNLPR
jgi:hypothetical protein